jgi:hypothetical protein
LDVGDTVNAVEVCHVLLLRLYEAPLVAEAVKVTDWPLQIAAVAGVKDTAGSAFTVTSAALAFVAEHPAVVFTYSV